MIRSSRLFEVTEFDLPRERLFRFGSAVLSDIELLAIILRSGDRNYPVLEYATKLLKDYGGFRGLLNTDINKLLNEPGLGIAKVASIKAACEIGLRLNIGVTSLKQRIKSSEDIYKLIRKEIFDKDREHLYLVSLDTRFQVLSLNLISVGTANETLVQPREIFKLALSKNAINVILVHNHPSEDPTPSEEDIKITKKVYEAGKTIGIRLVDHIIVANNSYISLKSLGVINESTKNYQEGR